VLLCRGAAPPLPVIGSTPDDTLLAVLDPLLAPSDTGAVADGATKPWSQVPRKRLLRVAGAFRADRLPPQPRVSRANPDPSFGACTCGARRQPSFLPLGFLPADRALWCWGTRGAATVLRSCLSFSLQSRDTRWQHCGVDRVFAEG
jgi:hypothetical protein